MCFHVKIAFNNATAKYVNIVYSLFLDLKTQV